MLQDLTRVDPKTIPLDDKDTMSIFSSTEALGVTPQQINSKVGTLGFLSLVLGSLEECL